MTTYSERVEKAMQVLVDLALLDAPNEILSQVADWLRDLNQEDHPHEVEVER